MNATHNQHQFVVYSLHPIELKSNRDVWF